MNSLGNPYKQSNKTFLYYRLLSSVHRNSLLLASLIDVFFFFLIRPFLVRNDKYFRINFSAKHAEGVLSPLLNPLFLISCAKSK